MMNGLIKITMNYRSLEYTFKLLWGKKFQEKMSAQSKHDLAFRTMMAKKPIEERYSIIDEEYEKLEREHHLKFKEK